MNLPFFAFYTPPEVKLADNASVQLDEDTEVQPDVLLYLEPSVGGKCQLTTDDYLAGPPELVVEIAGSSATYDLHDKLKAYQQSGVQEYVVWRIYDAALDWFVLQQGQYKPLQPNTAGIIKSQVFPGLWLAVEALLDGDMLTVLEVLEAGMDTEDYKKFVEKNKKVG